MSWLPPLGQDERITPNSPDKDEVQGLAGTRLDLRAAGPLPHRPRPAGAGRARHTTPLAHGTITSSSAREERSGSSRLKNEWIRPGRLRVW